MSCAISAIFMANLSCFLDSVPAPEGPERFFQIVPEEGHILFIIPESHSPCQNPLCFLGKQRGSQVQDWVETPLSSSRPLSAGVGDGDCFGDEVGEGAGLGDGVGVGVGEGVGVGVGLGVGTDSGS